MVVGVAMLKGVKLFLVTEWSTKGSGVGLVMLRMHKKKPIYRNLLSAPIIHNICLQQVRNPRSSQQIYSMMVTILSSLLIPHNFSHAILIGSNTILNKIQRLWVFQIFCGFILFNLSIFFALLLERSGGICNLESLAAFVNEILLSSCSALFFLERHTLSHFHTVLTPLSLEERRKCEAMRTSI